MLCTNSVKSEEVFSVVIVLFSMNERSRYKINHDIVNIILIVYIILTIQEYAHTNGHVMLSHIPFPFASINLSIICSFVIIYNCITSIINYLLINEHNKRN